MPEQDEDIELALAALRPRPPAPAVERALAESLDAPREGRSNVILWFSVAAAAACAALAFLVLPGAQTAVDSATFAVAENRVAPTASAAAPQASVAVAEAVAAPGAGLARGFGAGLAKSAAPYRLVSVQASPASLEMLEPVRLRDGTYVRPVRMRREHSTHWEAPGSGARLVRYRPEENTLFLPLETY